MDFIPEKSEIQIEKIEVKNDNVLKQMIKDLGVKNLIPGLPKERGNRRTKSSEAYQARKFN